MKLKVGSILFASTLALTLYGNAFATAYNTPPPNQALIGKIRYTTTGSGDTPKLIASRYDVGFNAIETANPHLNAEKGFPYGAHLQIPSQHLLPNTPREGIVVNLPEMRMYYYPAGTGEVLTYPIGIGKIGKTIPIMPATLTKNVENPSWSPPDDIREFNLTTNGIVLPKVMPPGPDNPLGPYAIYMSIPTYLIHSTIFPESIGKRASFGCIRMYESDIKEFFPIIESGVQVAIINEPVKTGWQDKNLYVEAHRALEEHDDPSLPGMVHMINDQAHENTLVDWQLVAYIAKERDGIPHEVGVKIKS